MNLKICILSFTFIISLIFCNSFDLIAQSDSIKYEPTVYGFKYTYNGEKINGNKVLEIVENNTAIYDQFKSANEANVFANIFGLTGIFLIGLPAGMELTGYEANWSMAWAGTGLVIVSIPLFYKYNKNIPIAIDMYNSSKPLPKKESSFKLNFGSTKNGIGFCFAF